MIGKLEGYRTIIVAALALVFSLAQGFGIVVSQDEQSAITAGVVAVLMILLRLVTKGPVGGGST